MTKNNNKVTKNKHQNSNITLILTNLAVQFSIFIIASLLSFIFGLNTDLFFIVSIISLCIGNFITGFISGRNKKQNGLLSGMLYSCLFNVIVVIVSVTLNKFKFDYPVLISLILPSVFSAIGGIIAVNFKRKSPIKR